MCYYHNLTKNFDYKDGEIGFKSVNCGFFAFQRFIERKLVFCYNELVRNGMGNFTVPTQRNLSCSTEAEERMLSGEI